jgi:hypothetical protein
MIRKLLFLSLITFSSVKAQFIVNPNPFNANSGVLTFTYGSAGDFSLYNPNGATTIYLYTGLETNGVTGTWEYHDTWGDVSTLIPLTLNSSGFYVGSADIGNRNYFSELTQTVVPAPAGTTVNNWYFLFRNAAGNSQSQDYIGTNFGFVPGTLSNTSFYNNDTVYFSNNTIYNNYNKEINVTIYTLEGKQIANEIVTSASNKMLNISQKGVYVAVLNESNERKIIKFVVN